MNQPTAAAPRAPLSWQRKLAFATLALALSAAVSLAGCLAADLYAHSRLDRSAGLNRWGYRGPVLGKKQPGEMRVAVLGGSTSFGYGVLPTETIAAYLQEKLAARRRAAGQGPISVANLGYNGEGAYAAKRNLIAYDYLDFDVAVFHDGYNDLGSENLNVYRETSPVFRLTGYMPVLPLLLRDKAFILRYGSLEGAYRTMSKQGPPVVFRPDLARRTTAATLEAAHDVSRALERQLEEFTHEQPEAASRTPASPAARVCGEQWASFCQKVIDNVDYALGHHMRVIVIGQPYHTVPIHRQQQTVMAQMIHGRYGHNPAVIFVDLGTAVDIRDQSLAFDGVHLTALGNARVADGLVEPLIDVLNLPPPGGAP
jgi:hypothetical protein